MDLTIINQNILCCRRSIAKTVAQIKTKGYAIHQSGSRAPVPGIAISPDTSAPVQHAKRVSGIKLIGMIAYCDCAAGPHTIDFLVEIKVARFIKGCTDNHRIFRFIKEHNASLDRLAIHKIIHSEQQLTGRPQFLSVGMEEGHTVSLAGDRRDTLC